MITVFTPSYNRKKELNNLYNSLLKQDTNDFEWLIVDDGSSDNTKEHISKLKKEKKITINYYYKENGGKQSAYNYGLNKAKGDIFLCIDSDDVLKENILKTVISDFEAIKDNDDICGVAYIQDYIKKPGEIIGSKFKQDKETENYYNIYYKDKVTGDKLIVLKTDIAKKYPFPMIEKEKFVPEALVFNRLAKKYKLYCRNIFAASKDYLADGYSNKYFDLVKRNPQGNRLYFKELYSFNKSLYTIYGYILFSIYSHINFKTILKEHPAKIRIVLMYLPTLVVSIIR